MNCDPVSVSSDPTRTGASQIKLPVTHGHVAYLVSNNIPTTLLDYS